MYIPMYKPVSTVRNIKINNAYKVSCKQSSKYNAELSAKVS